MVTVID